MRICIKSYWYVIGSSSSHGMYDDFVVVGHCNGLLCILQQATCRFMFWNPATKISFELPKRGHVFENTDFHGNCGSKYGFGWDEESGAYKVFLGKADRYNQRVAQVYSSKTNSWKTIEHGSLSLSVGLLVCGKVHWLSRSDSDKRIFIESFDLKSEAFGVIELPWKSKAGFQHWMWDCGGNIQLARKDDNKRTSTVWEMKESWAKMTTVDFSGENDSNHCFQVYCYIESLVSPVVR